MRMMKLFFTLIICALATPTNVILTFDDGWADHYDVASKLDEHGLKGTFYINSGRVGRTQRMTLDQIRSIADRGHEIASHTITHFRLTSSSYEAQKNEICEDRRQLLEWGFRVTTFAYPYGADTPESYDILAECGFNSARDSGGIKTETSCQNCPTVEASPPGNPLQMRSFSYRQVMGVSGLQYFVNQALSRPSDKQPGGALIIVFHEYGDYPEKSASITKPEFEEFLVWLTSQSDVNVLTVDQFIGGEQQPIFDQSLTQIPGFRTGVPHISLTFDDGSSDHLAVAQVLESHSFRGTFFINSGNVNQQDFLTSNQVEDLYEAGHEIGGHTRTSPRLYELNEYQLDDEICTDKRIIERWLKKGGKGKEDGGDSVTSISWPFGQSNNTIEAVARGCGYLRGRDVGGIKVQDSCERCPSSVDIPTSNPLRLRSFIVKSFHSLGDLMWQVLRAEESYSSNAGNPESVLIFTFEKVCDGCAFSPEEFENFLRWLKPRQYRGTTVGLLRDLI